jgi:hypothetical protein
VGAAELPSPTAGRLGYLKVGDGCVGEAAEPADVVTILRGRRRRCKPGARDSDPLCDLTTRHARFGPRGGEELLDSVCSWMTLSD